ncbi:heterogeneous nuclear ribonucleoprotein A1-like [Clavelina lepadiformis]|uniref:RRM domain-containing protein n=1 Tax=Clavelina lepadiformis TaxID=159417 RepID=A0ABP0FU45_CLALP
MPFDNNEEEQGKKLFVGGLSFEATDASMEEYFSQYGKVVDCVAIKDPNGSKPRGFGFVTYESVAQADECMNARPHYLHNRQVDVKRAVSRTECMKPGAHVQVKKIFVGGVKRECTEDELREFFGTFGNIESVEIPVDRETKMPRGFAFVTFDDFDAVDKLVAEKRHYEFCGMSCEVKKALSKQEMEKAKTKVEAKNHFPSRRGSRGDSGYRAQRGYERRGFEKINAAPNHGGDYYNYDSEYQYDDYGASYYHDGYDYNPYSNQPSHYGPYRGPAPRPRGSYSGRYGGQGYASYGEREYDAYNDSGYGSYRPY